MQIFNDMYFNRNEEIVELWASPLLNTDFKDFPEHSLTIIRLWINE